VSLAKIDSSPCLNIQKNKKVVVYAGGLTSGRGIKEVVQAMENVVNGVELWLIGSWQSSEFQTECETLEGWKRVKYLGYMTVQDVYSHMKCSDIGIITFLPAPNHITTLATKPFEYMACNLPVIMSNFEYWKEVFSDTAVYVDPTDSDDIAKSINKLVEDTELAKEFGERGRKFTEQEHSWEKQSKILLKIYSSFLTDK
jgi:glycosyltransferase involved in cell wall biosynthesis